MYSSQETKPAPQLKRIKNMLGRIKSLYSISQFDLDRVENFLNSISAGSEENRDLTMDEQDEFLKLYVLNGSTSLNYFFQDVFRQVICKFETFDCSRLPIDYYSDLFRLMINNKLFNRETIKAFFKFIEHYEDRSIGAVKLGFVHILQAHELGLSTITQQDFLALCESNYEFVQMLFLETALLIKANYYLNVDNRGCGHVKSHLIEIIEIAKENLQFLYDQKAHAKMIFNNLEKIRFGSEYDRSSYRTLIKAVELGGYQHDATLGEQSIFEIFSTILQDRKTINKAFWEFYYSNEKKQDQLSEELYKVLPASGISSLIGQYMLFKEPEMTAIPSDNFVSNYFQLSDDKSENKTQFNQEIEKYLPTVENLGEYAPLITADILESLGLKNKMLVPKLGRFDTVEEFASQIQWPEKDERYIAMIVPTLKNAQGIPQHATLVVIDLKKETAECLDSLGLGTNSGIHEVTKLIKDLRNLPTPKDEKVSSQQTRALELKQHLRDFKIVTPPYMLEPQQNDQFHCVTHCVANMMGIIAAKEKLNAEKCDPKVKDFIEKAKINVAKGEGLRKRTRDDLIPYAGILHLAAEAHNKNRIADDAVKIKR